MEDILLGLLRDRSIGLVICLVDYVIITSKINDREDCVDLLPTINERAKIFGQR
jgi:hypothetical protein